MKSVFTVLGIASLVIVAVLVSTVTAQPPQPGVNAWMNMTPAPQGQGAQPYSAPAGSGNGMMGGRMGGKMGGHMGRGGMAGSGMASGMTAGTQSNTGPGMAQGQTNGTAGSGYGMSQGQSNAPEAGSGMLHETMMAGVTPMYSDVAGYLRMTAQDLYNHMAGGKSMVQIAKDQGITEQQLMDAIMIGRQTAYGQAVKGGYMTQAQADAMYQNMNSSLKEMVQSQGYGSSGWSMMWGPVTTPQPVP